MSGIAKFFVESFDWACIIFLLLLKFLLIMSILFVFINILAVLFDCLHEFYLKHGRRRK